MTEKEGACKITSIKERLGIPSACRCICVVGAGGKTSLLYRLAEEYRAENKRVLLCTTTKMYLPETDFVPATDPEKIFQKLERDGFAVSGSLDQTIRGGFPMKIGPLSPEIRKKAWEKADVILVEGDGSRRLPVKFPGQAEPVIPEECDFLIAVGGFLAIGKRLEEVCHRPRLAAERLKAGMEDLVTPELFAEILETGYGRYLDQRQGCFYLNQADCADDEVLQRVKAAAEKIENERRKEFRALRPWIYGSLKV